MKKLFNSIRSKFNNLSTRAVVAVCNTKAEGYVDTGVKILISVVIGICLTLPISSAAICAATGI